MEIEIWKQYKEKYFISNFGRLKNIITGRILKFHHNSRGYLYTTISINNSTYTVFPHRMVAEKFIPNIDCKPEVNHKDGNKDNNYFYNLEWVTGKENVRHAFDNNLNYAHNKRRVAKLDLDGNIIDIYNSIAEAAQSLGIYEFSKTSHIIDVCKNRRKSAYKHKWKYI